MAQDFQAGEANTSIISEKLIPASRRGFYEVNRIEIKGNKTFENEVLMTFLISQVTSRGTIGLMFNQLQYLSKGIEKTGAPKFLDTNVTLALDKLENGMYYFSEIDADLDENTLEIFYRTKGFHFVDVFYTFMPDTNKKENVLTFHINENQRYYIGSIQYIGLDSLPPSVDNKVRSAMRLDSGDKFIEEDVINEAAYIQRLLKNRGYYSVTHEIDTIYIREKLTSDSVRVVFNTGNRYKIGRIDFVDSTYGQPKVIESLKRKLLTFSEGDYYNQNEMLETQYNLLGLGTFDQVRIDTSSRFAPQNDSTLNFVVLLSYKDQRTWSIGWFTNKTEQYDNWNMGVEGEINHSNIFNAAQKANLYSNVALKNFVFNWDQYETEYNAGASISQPILGIIRNFRIGGSIGLQFSQSEIESFKVRRVALPIDFPIRFPRVNWIDRFDVSFIFEHENPYNYDEFEESNIQQNERLIELAYLYSNLNDYLKGTDNWITSSILRMNWIADHRDNIFNPYNGHFFEFSAETSLSPVLPNIMSGLAEYFRASGTFTAFHSGNRKAVHAFKIKLGTIALYNSSNNYVPTDRMFYAGGSNSNRGWSSRKLHYSDVKPELNPTNPDSAFTVEDYNLFSNIIGSGVLIEGSYEIRYNFGVSDKRFSKNDDGGFGMVAFTDIGNAYHWFVEGGQNEKTKISAMDYLKGLAVAVGIGFRFNTTVGPLRFDIAVPVKGPVFGKNEYIWYRENAIFSDMQFHFGIGHAF